MSLLPKPSKLPYGLIISAKSPRDLAQGFLAFYESYIAPQEDRLRRIVAAIRASPYGIDADDDSLLRSYVLAKYPWLTDDAFWDGYLISEILDLAEGAIRRDGFVYPLNTERNVSRASSNSAPLKTLADQVKHAGRPRGDHVDGIKLRKYRTGLTQAQLAESCAPKLTVNTIQRGELGGRWSGPTFEIVAKALSKQLGRSISPEDFKNC